MSSLKVPVVSLNNGKRYASVPVGHSVQLKDTYENMSMLLWFVFT